MGYFDEEEMRPTWIQLLPSWLAIGVSCLFLVYVAVLIVASLFEFVSEKCRLYRRQQLETESRELLIESQRLELERIRNQSLTTSCGENWASEVTLFFMILFCPFLLFCPCLWPSLLLPSRRNRK